MQDLLQKEKLKNTLISEGFNPEIIDNIVDTIINGVPDRSEHMTPENRVSREEVFAKFKKDKAA